METKTKENQPSSKLNRDEERPLSFLRFSGMASEILGFVLIGYWLGSKLDYYFQTESVLTLVGILMGILGTLFNLFRKLPKN